MKLETLYNNIIKDLDEYRLKYPEKNSQSVDFIPTFKTRHSSNITLEDWNALQQYVSNLNSDSSVQDSYLNNLTESLKNLIHMLQDYDNDLVHKTGDELIDGQKVFSGNVEVPNPETNYSAINKHYLEDNYDKKEDVVHTSGEKAEVITGEKTFTEAIKVDGGYGYTGTYASASFTISKETNNGYMNYIESEVDVDYARLTIVENGEASEIHGNRIIYWDKADREYDMYFPKSSGTFATEEFVGQKVNELLDGAPEQYNTLKELADYVKSDETATSKILGDINNLKENKADKSELENIDYEEIKNKPAEAIFVVRDKVSDDTTQTAKEIEINGTKWAVGGEGGSSGVGTEVVANEELDGNEVTLNSLTIDGTRYNANKLKLVAEGEGGEIGYSLTRELDTNKIYLVMVETDTGYSFSSFITTFKDAIDQFIAVQSLVYDFRDDELINGQMILDVDSLGSTSILTQNMDGNEVNATNSSIKLYELPFSL